MKIPDKLKVGANNISIHRVELTESDADQNGGWFEWETNKMCIAKGMPEDREATCFLHEILHAVNIYMTEEQATYISESLVQVIRDNNLDFRKGEVK